MLGPPSLGVTLPTFTADGTLPVTAARAAEDGGLDGVFAFDHLWPMGAPGRPALWSFGVLAAVAAATSRVRVGPLVARIGLLPEDDLVRMFASLGGLAGRGRLIAGLGAGDHLSASENRAYGLPYPVAAERLAAAARVLDALRGLGIETWMGARSAESVAAAARADALNTWGTTPDQVRALAGAGGQVTWAGQVLVGRDRADLARLTDRYGSRPEVLTGTVQTVAAALDELGSAGARWCVLAPLDYLAEPQRSVETVCLVAEAVR